MLERLALVAQANGLTPQMLVMIGVGLAASLLFLGLAGLVGRRNVAAERLAATAAGRAKRRDHALLLPSQAAPGKIMQSILPKEGKDRTALERKLAMAGLRHPAALRRYMTVRVLMGLGLPLVFVLATVLAHNPGPWSVLPMLDRVAGLSSFGTFRALAVMVALGYYLPSAWLERRIRERQLRIGETFPNALDLLQVSVEAGLGLDAAMTRVANEMAEVAPELSAELTIAQLEIQAGRPRDQAIRDMAERTGLEIVRSFAGVIQQSMQFGTPIAEALTTYAEEMRQYREMMAQEMANKLPVKMSAVLASVMLPVLVIVTVGPTVIRYMAMMNK
ncbi:type II secretion system F family protein [Frigidibacter sp. MR17.14]|uniref:type II secretion system F family protein n=1 Tax=Frigidibacter sp. MR17.14 TaxID=3126509 RepID=UPI003012E686